MSKVEALKKPFHPEDIEWRIQSAGMSNNGQPWALAIPYITNRAVRQRLDDVFPLAWENAYKPDPKGRGWLCGITIWTEGRSITRWDGAEDTDIEAFKGGLSNAGKRAGAQFGIGSYLYQFDDAIFASVHLCHSRREAADKGHQYQWVKPGKHDDCKPFGLSWEIPDIAQIAPWAMPEVDPEDYIRRMEECKNLDDLKTVYVEGVKACRTANDPGNEAKLIKLKNSMKSAIESAMVEVTENERKNALSWVELKAKEFQAMAANPEALKSLAKRAGQDLKAKYNNQPFYEEVERALVAEIAKLRTGEK